MVPWHRTPLFCCGMVVAPMFFGQNLLDNTCSTCIFLKKTTVLTALYLQKPMARARRLLAMLDVSATYFLKENEGLSVYFCRTPDGLCKRNLCLNHHHINHCRRATIIFVRETKGSSALSDTPAMARHAPTHFLHDLPWFVLRDVFSA